MLISFPFSVIFFFFFFFCRDLADFHLNTLHVGLCQSDSGSSLNCFSSIFVSVLCISCIYFSVISHQKQEPSPSACLHDDISLCLQSFWSFPSTVSSPFLLAFLPVIPACVICHQGFSPPHLHPHLLAADVMWCDGMGFDASFSFSHLMTSSPSHHWLSNSPGLKCQLPSAAPASSTVHWCVTLQPPADFLSFIMSPPQPGNNLCSEPLILPLSLSLSRSSPLS